MRGRGSAPKKSKLYHSQIVKTPIGIRLKFMSDVKDSQFPDGNDHVFVELEDGSEAMFFLENADIRSAVEATPQKKWVLVRGDGSGEKAYIVIDEQAIQRPDTPPDAKPLSHPQPLTGGPEKAEEEEGNDWVMLACDATDIAARIYGRLEASGHPLDSAGKASVFSTIFIAMDRRG